MCTYVKRDCSSFYSTRALFSKKVGQIMRTNEVNIKKKNVCIKKQKKTRSSRNNHFVNKPEDNWTHNNNNKERG